MKRIILGGSVLLLALVAGLVVPSAVSTAGAQATTPCFPGTAYPPGTPQGEAVTLVEADFTVIGNAAVSAELEVGGLNPGDDYCGYLFSTPVTLDVRTADAEGTIRYQLNQLPSDFALDAMHHLDIYREGLLIGSFPFCVSRSGEVVPNVTQCPRDPDTTTTTTPGATTTVANSGATSTTRAVAVLGSRTPTGGGSLAKTGADRIVEIVRIGLVLLAVGAIARYLRRRRIQRHVA